MKGSENNWRKNQAGSLNLFQPGFDHRTFGGGGGGGEGRVISYTTGVERNWV